MSNAPTRDKIERRREKKLTREVVAGVIDARLLNEYHWRVWLVAKPGHRALDYWPRTGQIRCPGNKKFAEQGSVSLLLKLLRAREI